MAGRRHRWLRGLPVLLAVTASLALPTSGQATQASATPPAPFDSLPTGTPPTTVPYAIGTTVYYGGRAYDLSGSFNVAQSGDTRQFVKVALTHGYVVTQSIYFVADVANVVGRFSPTVRWARLETALGGISTFDVTTGGLVVMPESGNVRALTNGAVYARWAWKGQLCADSEVVPAAVGYRVLQRQIAFACAHGNVYSAYLWYPGATSQQLPANAEGVGRIGGWIGYHTGSCWTIVSASAPSASGRQVCSMVRPLVSADGSRAVVVQWGRVRVYRLGTTSSVVMTLPAVASWVPGVRDEVPAVWETTDLFLVTARYNGALALVRCSATTGRCQRAVRTTVRPGVSAIVTERGFVISGSYYG